MTIDELIAKYMHARAAMHAFHVADAELVLAQKLYLSERRAPGGHGIDWPSGEVRPVEKCRGPETVEHQGE